MVADPGTRVAAPIGGTAVVTSTWLPSLWARGAPPGGIVRAELFSPAGDFVLFEVGLAADAIPLLPDAGLAFRAWTVQAFSGTFAGEFKFSNPTGCALN